MIYCPVPDEKSFGGRDYAGANAVIEALKTTKEPVEKLPIDVEIIEKILQNTKNPISLRAVSTPNAGYLLRCNKKNKSLIEKLKKFRNKITPVGENIFKKYKIRTTLLWDDPLGQFTNEIFNFKESGIFKKRGILVALKKYFSCWPCTHISWDSGHIDWVRNLGIIDNNKIKYNPLHYSSNYEIKKDNRKCSWDLSFFGNLYIHNIQSNQYFHEPNIKKACHYIKELITPFSPIKRIQIIKNAYNLFINKESIMPEDDFLFWEFYRQINWYFINTIRRQQILEGIKRDVFYFGNFADPKSLSLLQKNLVFQGNLDYFRELPEAFERSRITIDVVNSLSINGINGKFYECFAANGFMLLDQKKDLKDILGEKLSNKITYSSVNDCNEKIDYYLKHEKEREEIRTEIKKIILLNHSPSKWANTILSIS